MVGQVFRRCSCAVAVTDADGVPVYGESGRVRRRELGVSCPGMVGDGHGTWWFQLDLPTGSRGRRRLRRGGLASADEAHARLERATALLAIAEPDDVRGRAELVALVDVQSRKGGSLPDPVEVADRYRRRLPLTPVPTVGEWLEFWLSTQRGLRPTTLVGYRKHIELYLGRYLGHIRLDRLRVADLLDMVEAIEERNELIRQVRSFFADPKQRAEARREDRQLWERMCRLRNELKWQKPIGATSLRRVFSVLRGALNAALGQRLMDFNPAVYAELPAGQQPRPILWTPERVARWQVTGEVPGSVMVWTPDQTGEFVDHMADSPWYGLYHVLAFTGMRRGELCGLHWTDVDLDDARLTVGWQLVWVDGDLLLAPPKTAAGRREIPLDAETAAVLRAHRKWQAAEREKAGVGWTDTGLVFTGPDGAAVCPDAVTRQFRRLVEAAGLPPIRLHDLRHGTATRMLASGTQMKVVQEHLGHSRYATSADYYTAVMPSLARVAAESSAALVPRRTGQARAA
jgi:integrase